MMQLSFREVILWVLDSNGKARAFYERLGMHSQDGAARPVETGGKAFAEIGYRVTPQCATRE
jgi:hypothetical protein